MRVEEGFSLTCDAYLSVINVTERELKFRELVECVEVENLYVFAR